jgi:hypothetical protein
MQADYDLWQAEQKGKQQQGRGMPGNDADG